MLVRESTSALGVETVINIGQLCPLSGLFNIQLTVVLCFLILKFTVVHKQGL